MTKTTRWSQQVDALLCKDFFERISRDWTILMSKVEHHHTLCCSREKRFRKGMFSNVFTCGMWLPCVRRISDEGGFELKLLWLQITNSWGIPTRNDTQLCIVIFKCMQEHCVAKPRMKFLRVSLGSYCLSMAFLRLKNDWGEVYKSHMGGWVSPIGKTMTS